MPPFFLVRRYSWLACLFGLCLLLVLMSGMPAQPQGAIAQADELSGAAPLAPREALSQARPTRRINGGTRGSSGQPAPAMLSQGVSKTVLSNGMTVFTKEVDTAPVVTVQVWYRVGSLDESPGINGIAHQLEHLMFKGTQDRPIQFGRFFSALGSESNAFTSYDMTAYFGTVEPNKLGALLVLEADRMQNSLIGEAELASEKRVVISELQGYENGPAYRLGRRVMRVAFPNSPYGLPVGGTKADVERFTVEQVRNYYRTFYRPDNATLIVVGNFKTEELLNQVQESFGRLSNPNTPLPVTQVPPTLGSQPTSREPIVLREAGSAALLNAVYPMPQATHPDVPAIQVMDHILTGGRSSRLYQALVESGLASSANGGAANLLAGGWYEVSATAVQGKSLADIDRVLQQTIAEMRDRPVTAEELDRAKTRLRASILLQNRDISRQAMQLGDDWLTTGDYQFTDRLLAAIQQVSLADIQRVARTYLAPNQRTIGFFEPTVVDAKADMTAGNAGQTSENFSPGAPVDPAEVAKYLPSLPPASQRTPQPLPGKLTLANGLEVLLLRDRSTPTVTLSGFIRAGTALDQSGTAGLASLTATNLMNGTTTQDALALAKTLENQGANLRFAANREGVAIAGASLAEDLPTLLQVLGNVTQNASFPDNELELSRQQALTALKLELDNPSRVGRRTFQQVIYPASHPYHSFPTEASLKAIQRSDVVRFYRQHYRPENTLLTLVGDFDPVQVRGLINQSLGTWQTGGQTAKLTVPVVGLPDKLLRVTPTLPGKTQSITFMGYSAIDRKDPRFYAALVMNQILGGDTLASRLGTEIRDRQGLTYGIYSGFQAGLYAGPFQIVMQTAPEDADRAIASTLKLLAQIRQSGVTAAEIATAQRSLASNYAVELANPSALSETILMNTAYGLGLTELQEFPAKILAVTPAQVQQVITDLLHPDRIVVVTAGPPLASQR